MFFGLYILYVWIILPACKIWVAENRQPTSYIQMKMGMVKQVIMSINGLGYDRGLQVPSRGRSMVHKLNCR